MDFFYNFVSESIGMGIVKKQTIQNSVIQYIGIVLGYFNAVILFTNFLDTEQYGLTRVLMAVSALYVNFSSLGAPKVLIRFFPYFRTEDRRHKGFLFFAAIVALIGFVMATLLYLGLKGVISEYYAGSTSLFNQYYYYVILLSFLMLWTNIMENFMIAKKETVLPYFLKSIFIRVVWIVEILMYHYEIVDFNTFIFLYVFSYFFNLVLMLLHQLWKGEIKFNTEFLSIRKRVVKVLLNYGFFSIVTGISNLLVNRIDLIMITFLMGLSSAGVYSIAYYISSVLLVPSTAIYRISMPVVADQWKNKRMDEMESLYKKSSINQLLAGGFVFLCIWLNIDSLFTYLKPEYADGKWIVFILSMSVLFNMATGINNIIIMITKYFRYDTFASISLGILTITTNLIFIPKMGLEGAALATLISVVAYHTYKFVLIIVKFKMQPFSMKTILAVLSIAGTFLVIDLLPPFFTMEFLEILLRCLLVALLFGPLVYFLKLSPDINDEVHRYIRKFS